METKQTILILVSIIFTAILLFLNQKFLIGTTFQPVIESILMTLEVTIILGLVTNGLLFKKIMIHVGETCNASISVLESGVKDIKLFWNEIDFHSLIQNSTREITIVSIYSNTWINTYTDELQQFIKKGKTRIEFIFLDPDSSQTIQAVEEKFKMAKEGTIIDLESKIKDSIEKVKSLKIPKGARKYKKVQIKCQRMPPAYSLYKFDDTIVFVPYLFSPGRTNNVPAYILKKDRANSLYDVYSGDIKTLSNNYSKDDL